MKNMPIKHRVNGFTLVELMITVAIIGILAAVALPAYTDYVRRGQLPEATSALSDYRIKMEQYYQDNRNYGAGACAAGGTAPAWNTFAPSGAKYFTYSCTTDGQTYKLTATGSSGKAVGHVYTITQADIKETTLFKGAPQSGKSCWLIRDEQC